MPRRKVIPVIFLSLLIHISSITRVELRNVKLLRVEDFVKLVVKGVVILQQNIRMLDGCRCDNVMEALNNGAQVWMFAQNLSKPDILSDFF